MADSSITTYTGKRFHLFNPSHDEICIEDIAHALSNLCRFTGHCTRFYSVAQHSWHASFYVPDEHKFEALMHDASEAYLNDLSRPLKHDIRMEAYLDAEGTVDYAIRTKFGMPIVTVPPYMTPIVKEIDDKLVYTEGRQLTRDTKWTDGHAYLEDLTLPVMTPVQAEHAFLARYAELSRETW